MTTTMPLRAGDRLGEYRILEPIGEGAFTTVYRAQDPQGQDVAIKIARAPEAREHLAREVHLAGAVSHPGIVRVLDAQLDHNPAYVVIEYCAGGNLRARIDQGALGAREAERVLLELLRALDFAHAKGVVHRDLKPENILLSSDGRARITDFGHAVKPASGLALSTGMGDDGEVAGTLDYMAPEQREGEGDHRVDLYAVGVIAFELVAGQRPDRNDDLADLARTLSLDELTRFERLYQGLATRLERRFATARDAMEVFVRTGEIAPGAPPTRVADLGDSGRSPSMLPVQRALSLLAVVVVLATIALGARSLVSGEVDPKPITVPSHGVPVVPSVPAAPPARLVYADLARTRSGELSTIERAALEAARTGSQAPAEVARAAGPDAVRLLLNAMCELDLGKIAELPAFDQLDRGLRAGTSLSAPPQHDTADHSRSGETSRRRLREDWMRAFHTREAGR